MSALGNNSLLKSLFQVPLIIIVHSDSVTKQLELGSITETFHKDQYFNNEPWEEKTHLKCGM